MRPRASAKAIPARNASRRATGPSAGKSAEPEVVVKKSDLAALPGLGGERDRLAEVVEPAGVAEVASGQAAEPEGAGRPLRCPAAPASDSACSA